MEGFTGNAANSEEATLSDGNVGRDGRGELSEVSSLAWTINFTF